VSGNEHAAIAVAAEFPLGSCWRNPHTGITDQVLAVGPCENLDGEIRIWLKTAEAEWPSNGWGIAQMRRCWERMPDPLADP
jgi:hypothetical protein